MLQSLRFQRLCLAILEKPGGKDPWRPNNGILKYGIRVPRNAKEFVQFDRDNVNSLWEIFILKELEFLIPMSVFKKLPSSLHKARARGFQFAPVWIMFYIKVDLRIKYRLVIGGQVVYLYRQEVYASTTKSVLSRILMKIAAANKLEVMMGDIGNAYLNAKT